MPTIKVNGKEYDAPAGKNVLQFCLDQGLYVPHYCYHPALTIAGNCRMCIVKGSGPGLRPGLMTSCTLPVQDKLEVETEAPDVQKAREGVLEFLLINHPLDCPVCDQAGECYLQDYSFKYGRDRSRFVEKKVTKHTKDVGRNIRIWGNRCIVCTRCVRFCEEVAGTGELNVVERGDHSIIDNFPGLPMDNLLSGNTADICPVGALLDKDFLYQARVWYMETADSVCPTCSVGCNLKVDTYQGQVKRLRPRENQAVNQWWLCDIGRYNHKFTSAPNRLGLAKTRGVATAATAAIAATAVSAPALEWERCSLDGALARTWETLDKFVRAEGAGAVAGLASAWLSNEELFLFRKFMKLGIGALDLGLVAHQDGEAHAFKSGFKIHADRNPNRRGAQELLGADAAKDGLKRVLDGIRAGRIKAVLAAGGIPGWEPDPALLAALRKLAFVAVLDVAEDAPLVSVAHVVLPGATWVEKDGTFTNAQGRVQRCQRALPPPGVAAPESDLLQQLLVLAGKREKVLSAQGVFAELAAEVPAFAGLSYRDLGGQGKCLGAAADPAVAAR